MEPVGMAVYSPSCRGSATLSVEPDINVPAATGAARVEVAAAARQVNECLSLIIPTNILFMTV
jgi:hypothetical protein